MLVVVVVDIPKVDVLRQRTFIVLYVLVLMKMVNKQYLITGCVAFECAGLKTSGKR
jgi:hypothetical protein